jgi:NADH:ubiquinone oxidoreductase, NADH-binding (51 kD) subunit
MSHRKIRSKSELEVLKGSILQKRDPEKTVIAISVGTCGRARGAYEVLAAFKEEIEKRKLSDEVCLRETGCHGFCEMEPLIVIYPKGIFYQKLKPEDVPEIVSETIIKGNIVDRLLYLNPQTGERIICEEEVPFYKKQQRLIFGNNRKVDPAKLEDYIAIGGYFALAKALSIPSTEIIEEIKKSGLRGRGGGGFPTGVKWESCRNAEGEPKYVLCNADEGDPGAYMDRALLEGNPHSIIEGVIIGAYAIGSHQGFVYVRNEYPLALKNVGIAIEQAREYGFLGEDILGTGFDFDIVINRGGGAFVCGESTALMASMEGKIGEPKAKYIHTVESGLWEKPSNLNNVETWANVPLIIDKGADWYTKIGTKGSKGTKIFSLVGKVNNTGLVEVPMGITLREVVYEIGGGIPNGKRYKAVQTGGPSGGCIPESLLNLQVGFDELTKIGSMMGSGGMIVMDEETCMVDIARYFLSFLRGESCGKCVPCREGIKRMLEILTDITEGRGKDGDIELLEELSEVLRDASLCALGTTAPNPILSTIEYFRDEYEAHIEDKRCPAGVCKELIHYFISVEKCTGCDRCVGYCPEGAITGEKRKGNTYSIDQSKCIKCGVCRDVCKLGAVIIK